MGWKTAETWAKLIVFGDAEFASFDPKESYMVEFAGLVQKIEAIQQDGNVSVNEDLLLMLKDVHTAFFTIGTRQAMREALSGSDELIARAEGREE